MNKPAKLERLFAIIAVAGSLNLLGCKPNETIISGQVFIVTQGAENIKLGGVEIDLVEKQEVADCLNRTQTNFDALIKKELKRAGEVLSDLQADSNRAYQIKEWYKHFPTIEDYLSEFQPVGVKRTFTDTDGRFSISSPNSKALALYAKAQRTTPL